ncbi:unnamed protein product [Ambrosiozyma monospora]|uniref:Unnamed protein product n=1 Tax=Ambrosiozyma monospora TaxID=43982 RepID=A0ACB5T1X9_AMBMO|nr:unnamed protein product [Ambrosiozyma monospora]
MNFSSVFFTIACLFQLAFAIRPPTDFSKTLVIYDKDDTDFISEHTQFLSLLKSRSLDYEVKSTFEFDNTIFEHGQKLYQNIIVFPTHAKTIVDERDLLKFSQKGGNLFIITDNTGIQTDVAIFLNQLGIYPSPKGYNYVDHHVKDANVISEPNLKYLTNAKVDELAFNDGSVALLSNSELLIPVLQASKSSFSANIDDGVINRETTWHSGDQGFRIVGFQGLNNARLTWVGSPAFFADGANYSEDLVADLVDFTLHVKGSIKTEFISHINVDTNETSYKVGDNAKFQIGLSHWNGEDWVPLNTLEDLQLEFIMLDPYYRLNLTLESDGVYSTTFKIPDQHVPKILGDH